MNIFEKYPSSTFLNGLPVDSDFFRQREQIVDLFSFLDGLEDRNFLKLLDQDPHAALWEMMVAKTLKSEGYEPTRMSDGGPDFVVEKDGKRIFIEAICPGRGDEGNPNTVQPTIHGSGIAQDIPTEQIVLRIRGALKIKKEKYEDYVKSGKVSESDICIIAICSSKIDRAVGVCPTPIMRATHGLGNPYVLFARDEGFVGEGIESCESIPKANGEEVDTTFFLSMDNSLISAVLYSDWSFSSLRSHLPEESLVHNPRARVPLPLGFVKRIKDIGQYVPMTMHNGGRTK